MCFNGLRGPILDTNKYVYHYTKTSSAIQYSLLQKKLRLSPLRDTNDPYEWYGNLFSTEEFVESDAQFFKWQHEYGEALKKDIKLICFAKDVPQNNDDFNIQLRGFCRPRMWAQYADNHSGVCFVINREEFLKRVHQQCKVVFDSDIKYFDHNKMDELRHNIHYIHHESLKSKPMEEIVNDIVKENSVGCYFTKGIDWREEEEYRIIVRSKTPIYIDLDGCLECIVTGLKFNQDNRQSLEIVRSSFQSFVELAELKFECRSYTIITGSEQYMGENYMGEDIGLL